MKTPIEFFTAHKHAIIWTALYVFMMWAILGGLFSFDMFSPHDWSRLMRAELRGFPGFVFGILILAMVPMYIATTTVIMRTNAPLFEFALVKKVAALFTPTLDTPADDATPTTPVDTPVSTDTAPTITDTPPKKLPGELCGAFNRARDHLCTMQSSDFDLGKTMSAVTAPDMVTAPDAVPVMANDIPLPTDFADTDFDTPAPTDDDMGFGFATGAPTFTDICFDTPSPAQVATPAGNSESMEKFLNARCEKIVTVDNDVIVTPQFAIATHDDDDFWVVDNESWFAAGKQKPAPDIAARSVAATHGVTPVLYLASKNIMDLERHREKWKSDGIMVITSPGELPLAPAN